MPTQKCLIAPRTENQGCISQITPADTCELLDDQNINVGLGLGLGLGIVSSPDLIRHVYHFQ